MKLVILALAFGSFVQAGHALPALDDQRIEKLKTAKISVAGLPVTAEMATTPDERERGLMYRKTMPAQDGMLFVFEDAQEMSFWMKNTWIPLSIGFFDENKKLLSMYEMTPAVMGEVRPKTYPSNGRTMYALEMNKDWFPSHHLKKGALLKIPSTNVERK